MSKNDDLRIGASWYPEMWPEKEWSADVNRMKSLGFNVVRMFEFAWHRFEPEEGMFDFEWAKRVMDLCQRAGIKVIAGTPTAAPPVWVSEKYPDALRVGSDGKRAGHGQRCHFSHISRTYRRLAATVVRRMAEELKGHPALLAWQIDNEMGGSDYGVEARNLFHKWLRNRYGTVENLNVCWGLEFWSQAYQRFEQVPLPVASLGGREIQERHHPSLLIAASRFQSEEWTSYIRDQIEQIRTVSDKPITTNMCGSAIGSNWYDHNKLLDRVGFSIYSDAAHYAWNTMRLERMRGEKPDRSYWLLETAPNWSGGGRQWNIHYNARGLKAMTWQSMFYGGSMMVYWQWRSHWAGQEMQHGTCVDATGRWRPNRDEWKDLAADFRKHSRWLSNHPPARADFAIVLDTEAAWSFSIDPIDDNMGYLDRWRDDYYLPLARSHVWRDVIPLDADFDRYRVIAVPMVPMLPERSARRLAAWVKRGGRLLLGPLTGYRSDEFTSFTSSEFGGLEKLMGADCKFGFSAQWREKLLKVEMVDGTVSSTRAWCYAFSPRGARAVAWYRGSGEYGDGEAAIVRHRVGRGQVTTFGCMLEPDAWMRFAIEEAEAAGVAMPVSGSGDVAVVPRADAAGRTVAYGIINLNLGPGQVNVRLPCGGTDRLSGRRVDSEIAMDPHDVLLVELDRTGKQGMGRR